jgi:hypothetical protein
MREYVERDAGIVVGLRKDGTILILTDDNRIVVVPDGEAVFL